MENILNALAKANKQVCGRKLAMHVWKFIFLGPLRRFDLCSICQRREGGGKPAGLQIDEKTRREMMAGTEGKVKGKIFDAFSQPQQKR